jgi:vancomycin permeability regulator SanA
MKRALQFNLAAIWKWTWRFFLVGAALYFLAALALALFGLREDAKVADVGVVFGNKVEPWGEPSPSLAARLDKAIVLYQRGLFPKVIVSGGMGKEGWDEAQVMADYLAGRGIPRAAILIDHEGNNTYLTALHTAQLAKEQGFHSFVLISHFYHLPRARLAFARFNLTPVTIAHADRFVARDFYYGLLREVIAYPAYFVCPYED